MPTELGLHLGARIFRGPRQRRKQALILDSKPHRYDVALSDISGQDIEVHGNDPDRAIQCVRDWLSDNRGHDNPPLPGVAAMRSDYRQFKKEIVRVLEAHRLDPLEELSHSDMRNRRNNPHAVISIRTPVTSTSGRGGNRSAVFAATRRTVHNAANASLRSSRSQS